VSSNFACIGLDIEDSDDLGRLLARIKPRVVELGRAGELRVLRWQDPSGARLMLGATADDVPDLLPSFAAHTRVQLTDVRMVNDQVAVAAVFDEDGEQLTAMTLELEQRRLVADGPIPSVVASVVALGTQVEVFGSAEEFNASDASLLSPDGNDGEPPQHYVDNGWSWPPRLAPESFISYGVFNEGEAATAHARLCGVVSSAERRIVQETGREVVVAVVSSVGMDVTVCLEGAAHPGVPSPGQVIAGTVFMTGSLEDWQPLRRGLLRGWRRR
jgi:hypothetical protein